MFNEFRESIRNKSPEEERLLVEIESCQQELRQAGFQMESFIKLTSGNQNPADNEGLGQELKRITENDETLKAKLIELNKQLEIEKSKTK